MSVNLKLYFCAVCDGDLLLITRLCPNTNYTPVLKVEDWSCGQVGTQAAEELLPSLSSSQLSFCLISFPGYQARIGILMHGSRRACTLTTFSLSPFLPFSFPLNSRSVAVLRRFLRNVGPKFQTRKKKLQFFSLNLLSIPWDIPWHHWKNLQTSKRGRSGGFNFFTKSCQIWLKTSGGSKDLNFYPICKCHTISETSWCPYEALQNWIDLRGH